MTLRSILDMDLKHQRVLIREDLNVPLQNGAITSDARIRAALPTLEHALQQQAAVMVMSHLGRPKEGEFTAEASLQPVADRLAQLLNIPVRCEQNWVEGISINPGELVLCENVRFNLGEKDNDPVLAKKMAALCDVFVMDAFATAHRSHASTVGVAEYAPIACAGPLLLSELDALGHAMKDPERPLIAVVGGSKVSTKLTVLEALIEKVNVLVVGGGIANTFLAARDICVGNSLYEKDHIDTARNILDKAREIGVTVPLPIDVIVAQGFAANASAATKQLNQITPEDMILDVGPKTAASYAHLMESAKTIVWNGPVGVFEFSAFAAGTKALGQAIADSNAFSIAGGGDTLAALDAFHLNQDISYISTGGGAFLEFLEGKPLPAVTILQQQASLHEH